MSSQVWVCLDCRTYFYPNEPDYLCPKCNGKSRPSITFDPDKHKVYFNPEKYVPKERKCSECSTVMVPGIITEAAESIMGLYHYDSVRWTAHGPRFIFPPIKSVFPTAYACPNCGKIELHIQLIKQEPYRQIKLSKWIHGVGLVGYCMNCKQEYDFYEYGYFCPKCKKYNTEIRH